MKTTTAAALLKERASDHLSSAEISTRLERARADQQKAAAGVATATQRYQDLLVAGENDLNVEKAQRILKDTREGLDACRERVRLLEEAFGLAQTREQGEERAAAIRQAAELMQRRVAAAEKIEKAAAALCETYLEFRQLSREVLAVVPERMHRIHHLPALFLDQMLMNQLQVRLMALSNGGIPAAKMGLTVWEAQKLPTLTELAGKERDLVSSLYAMPGSQSIGKSTA